jgi:hypothetical protein
VVEIPPADELRVLLTLVTEAVISELLIVTTPSPGATLGVSGAGIVVVVVVVVEVVVDVAPMTAPLATVVAVVDEEFVGVVLEAVFGVVVDEAGEVLPMLINALL